MNKETEDFIVNIIQDVDEINSILKVLKDSVNNENCEIEIYDIANSLEIIISKVYNTKIALNKLAQNME